LHRTSGLTGVKGVCPKRMHWTGTDGEGKLTRWWANPGSRGRWPLKWMCVCMLTFLVI